MSLHKLCKCSWFQAKTIYQMCTSYKLKQMFERKIFSYEKGKHIMNKKAKKSRCHLTTFYSKFKARKQNDLPKIT